ncbi:MAG: orotidine-5'-phosphate decarboxylase [Candidatus Zixiibacteriota bacterium]|nr:MAG: orotidine-5'-phosphate decarboxylase [candidate division Zixibacteria bacterium]
MITFNEKLLKAADMNKSWLCVGLDSDLKKIPRHLGTDPEAILKFNRSVIESTSDLVCAYKPNSAFYESLGPDGMRILKDTIGAIPDDIPVILDFKRGDIGNTAAMYARSAFEYYGADAVTVNPYLGHDSIEPFINYKDKGVFVLCVTSNRSSNEIQKRLMIHDEPPPVEGISPLAKAKTLAEFFRCSTSTVYMHIAALAMEWNNNANVGLVVGATSPSELEKIRKKVGEEMPVLIPGVGAQGGDLESAVKGGSNSNGDMAIINVSRGIIYSNNGSSFQESVRRKAAHYRDAIMAVSKKKRAQKKLLENT